MNLNSIIPWKKEDRQMDRRREDGDPFAALQRRMNSLFDDFFGYSSSDWWGANGNFAPRLEVSETGKEIRISAELPGLDEKDVEVTFNGNMLTIKGEKREEKEEEQKEKHYHLSERRYGSFSRSFTLPETVAQDKITAAMKDGILTLTLPKTEAATKQPRKIEITGNQR
jgi:HSP20 family protein